MQRRIISALATLGLLLAGLVGITGFAAPASAFADRDCGDFSTQAAAQNFFLQNGGPGSDPHGLDAEGDGIACESNPCPCNYDRSPGGGGGGDGRDPKPKPEPIKKDQARVIKVIDGDTVRVKLAGGRKRDVRLLGIDTPEVYGGRECGGPQATRTLKKLLPPNTQVVLVSDRTQSLEDKYQRLLRYVMKGRQDASLVQVRLGRAKVATYGKRVARHGAYTRAQSKAKRQDAGSWRSCW